MEAHLLARDADMFLAFHSLHGQVKITSGGIAMIALG